MKKLAKCLGFLAVLGAAAAGGAALYKKYLASNEESEDLENETEEDTDAPARGYVSLNKTVHETAAEEAATGEAAAEAKEDTKEPSEATAETVQEL